LRCGQGCQGLRASPAGNPLAHAGRDPSWWRSVPLCVGVAARDWIALLLEHCAQHLQSATPPCLGGKGRAQAGSVLLHGNYADITRFPPKHCQESAGVGCTQLTEFEYSSIHPPSLAACEGLQSVGHKCAAARPLTSRRGARLGARLADGWMDGCLLVCALLP